MRVLCQRVQRASVTVQGRCCASIEAGLLVFVCVEPADTPQELGPAIDKLLSLRLFPGAPQEQGAKPRPFDRSLQEIDGACLVVSQFTLAARVGRGRRPSFDGAAGPQIAKPLYEQFIDTLRAQLPGLQTGEFGANMQVELVNDGPVTLGFRVHDGKVHDD